MESLKKSGYAPVNGISMYYEIHGEGAVPLVLIHGGGSTIDSSFGRLLPLLANQRPVIAVELQAHGRTTDRDAPESFVQDADDVAALLKYLAVDKADILGFSNGGSTAMQIAIRHPGLVRKLIVVAGGYLREGFPPGFFDYIPGATLSDMPAVLQEAFLLVTPDRDRLQTMFDKDRQRMIEFRDWCDDDLKSIKAPTLFISEDHDVMLPEHTLRMSRLVEGAQLLILPGIHGSWMEALEAGPGNTGKAAITAQFIDRFLAG
jgi:pimeloyl-ACP methyl ester carboxylesterase